MNNGQLPLLKRRDLKPVALDSSFKSGNPPNGLSRNCQLSIVNYQLSIDNLTPRPKTAVDLENKSLKL